MGIKDSAKSIAATLKLDSHHGIERFGVFFAAILASFVLIFTSAAASSVGNQRHDMDSTVLYTPTFSTSKTQVDGEVSGVYVNADRTRAMVLMHFKDAGQMSANAAKYQGFLTGATTQLNDQQLKSHMTGKIVSFGSTGYLAMVIDSDQPFAQQILNLTMRANSELVYTPNESREVRADLAGQKTFSQYDQWRLYFNPGATGATFTKALDGKEFDASAVYAQLVVEPQEKTARKTLEADLAQMQVDQSRIAEYTSEARRQSVDGIRLVVPDVPSQIAGDVVSGKVATDGKPSTLQLEPKWVSPEGFDFNWRDGSVEKGYLDQITPKGESYVEFLNAKAQQSKDGPDGAIQPDREQWKLSNGALLSDYAANDSTMQPLTEIHNELAQSWSDYYQHKTTYQVDDLQTLLDLEVDLRNVQSASSTNSTAKALFTY